jgi:hypothetical protein
MQDIIEGDDIPLSRLIVILLRVIETLVVCLRCAPFTGKRS